jgi:osmotically inducible protein OsmC
MPIRRADATWEGRIADGKGSFRGHSGLAANYSFSSRFENGAGSNPEELLAAAEAACFSMALALALEKAGATPTRVDTEASCSIDKIGDSFKITKVHLSVRVLASGISESKFQEVARVTKQTCPVSVALAAVPIDLQAALST